ncbi:hypothetical protein O0C60_00750 [Staphylococcus pseudintermedius]|nr:hypothetical protein [Staphylococcus pseudintermedius]
MLAIKMNDIDFENQTIRIDESYDQKSDTCSTTKNGEIRILDFSNSYKNILNQMLKLHETNKVLHEDLYNNDSIRFMLTKLANQYLCHHYIIHYNILAKSTSINICPCIN